MTSRVVRAGVTCAATAALTVCGPALGFWASTTAYGGNGAASAGGDGQATATEGPALAVVAPAAGTAAGDAAAAGAELAALLLPPADDDAGLLVALPVLGRLDRPDVRPPFEVRPPRPEAGPPQQPGTPLADLALRTTEQLLGLATGLLPRAGEPLTVPPAASSPALGAVLDAVAAADPLASAGTAATPVLALSVERAVPAAVGELLTELTGADPGTPCFDELRRQLAAGELVLPRSAPRGARPPVVAPCAPAPVAGAVAQDGATAG